VTDRISFRRQGDRLLLVLVDAAFAESAGRASRWCACRPGCTECCQGPFPINALDAWRLREGLEMLEARDPERAAAVRERAGATVRLMTPDFPGDPATGILGDDERAEEGFCERHASLPCPALDLPTGTCDLYESRPISCRTYGPPLRFGDQSLAPCRLWFQGAPPDAIEHARVEPDPEDRERDLLEAVSDGMAGDTLVAFVLAGIAFQ
jgi:Fe-S-cluster containining protein